MIILFNYCSVLETKSIYLCANRIKILIKIKIFIKKKRMIFSISFTNNNTISIQIIQCYDDVVSLWYNNYIWLHFSNTKQIFLLLNRWYFDLINDLRKSTSGVLQPIWPVRYGEIYSYVRINKKVRFKKMKNFILI